MLHRGGAKFLVLAEVRMENFIVLALTTLVSAFIGSYLAAYLKKKGENLATHEDINKLVEQVGAVTKATKDIEAKISNEVWDRQKRWELRREVLFEATRRLSVLDKAVVAYGATLKIDENLRDGAWDSVFHRGAAKLRDASSAFNETQQLVAVVCNKETHRAFESYSLFAGEVGLGITAKDANIFEKSHSELVRKFLDLRAAIRKELEIDRPA
jgi:hypothetical protein